MVCVVNWDKSAGCPLLVTPGTVWAFWAIRVNNSWCISDLGVGLIAFFVFCVWVLWSGVHFDLHSLIVGSSCGEAMVEFIPLIVASHYWCWRVRYLPAEVAISSVVSQVICFNP